MTGYGSAAEELRDRSRQRADAAEARAAGTLTYYLRAAWTAAGLPWNGDNEAEVRELLAAIREMAAAQAGADR